MKPNEPEIATITQSQLAQYRRIITAQAAEIQRLTQLLNGR